MAEFSQSIEAMIIAFNRQAPEKPTVVALRIH
jgi:hypothetical protein